MWINTLNQYAKNTQVAESGMFADVVFENETEALRCCLNLAHMHGIKQFPTKQKSTWFVKLDANDARLVFGECRSESCDSVLAKLASE